MADPTQTNITQTSIPDYAKPFVESMLGQGQALTDVNRSPYMQYMGDRIAQFNPLQQQSFLGAKNMQTAPQLGQATNMAGAAGLAALNTDYGAPAQYQNGTFGNLGINTQNFNSDAAQQYMNPYMQNVVDIQKREANRAAGQQAVANAAKFAGAGAFGGSRQAIAQSEANRNLAQQLGDIQATGSNQAFQQAMQQFNADQSRALAANQSNQQANLSAQQMGEQSRQYGATLGEQSRQYGAGLGLQGLQTANAAATNLANIGNTQFGQNMGINQLQNQYGGQQQQQVQNVLNNQYQDYLNQQNYPYQQLSFMSNLLRGLPMTNQTAQVYQAPANPITTVAGGAIAAKGLGLYKDGGKVESDGLAGLALSKMA